MTTSFVALLIVAAGLLAFFGSVTRKGVPILAVSILLAALGIAGVLFLEKGPQAAFAKLPISATQLAWSFSSVALVGFGAFLGAVTALGFKAAKKRS